MNTKNAREILEKLHVKSGLRPSYCDISEDLSFSMFYFDDDNKPFNENFKIEVRGFWSGQQRTKTVSLFPSDVQSKSKSMWTMDKTYRLTESGINRIEPSLQEFLDRILGK